MAFSYEQNLVSRWDMSTINPVDLGFRGLGNNGVGTGLVTATDIVQGRTSMATEFDGAAETVDFGDIGIIRTLAFWVKPATTTEELFLLDAGMDIMVNAGTITYTGVGSDATYVNGVAGTTLVANVWRHVVCVLDADTDCNNFEAATDGANFGAIVLDDVRVYNTSLTNLDAADLMARSRRGATGG